MLRRIAISLLCLFQVFALEAHLVSGRVYDTASELPLVGVSVAVLNSQQGTITGTNGEFTLNCNLGDTLKMTAIGYETATMPVTSPNSFINVPMTQKPIGLNEVVVKGGKYSKKNNPAVELAKKLIASRNSRRLNNCDYFEREKYQRMAYGLNDFDNRKDNHVLNRYPFLAEYADTVTLRLIARPVLPVSIDENVAQESFSKTDNSITSTTQEKLHVGIDDSFDIEGIKTLVEQLIGDTDIFQNDIQCLNYRFMSPIADMGTQFYKYFLADTLDVDGEQCVELQFVPFNTQDLGFVGRMYVTCDSSLFIKRVELNFPQNINLNFIGAFTVSIAYMRAPGNAHAKTDEDAIVEFSIFKNAQTLFARHTSKFTKYAFTPNHNGTMSISSIDDYAVKGKLTAKKLNQMIARLRSNKQFFWSEVVIKALVQDYFPTTADPRKSPVDIGPISSTFASNELEGFITRLGATTTPALNKHFSADAYVAYGWKDQKLKYGASATISFNERKAFKCEKPYNALTLSHGFGSHLLGNDFMFTPADNQFFTLLTRKPDDKRLYLHATSLEYKKEWGKWLATANVRHDYFEPTKFVEFHDALDNTFSHYSNTAFSLSLRWAPKEKVMATRRGRIPMNDDAMIFFLSHSYAPRNMAGNDLTSNITRLGVQQRFWLSAWGFADVIMKYEKQWNRVNFINLLIPSANLTYSIQPESFALMNVMEFVNDEQLSCDVKLRLNGLMLNRLPIIKKLKLREVISFRGLWGTLSHKNDPELNPQLFRFPNGVTPTKMGSKPYLELGVGVENILHLIRLDYVWRLNYRDNPHTDKSGLRFQINFTF